MLKLPLKVKLRRSREIIRIFTRIVPENRLCVACSFGKDSIFVLYLVKQYLNNPTVLFNNTHVQYPETYRFKNKVVN